MHFLSCYRKLHPWILSPRTPEQPLTKCSPWYGSVCVPWKLCETMDSVNQLPPMLNASFWDFIPSSCFTKTSIMALMVNLENYRIAWGRGLWGTVSIILMPWGDLSWLWTGPTISFPRQGVLDCIRVGKGSWTCVHCLCVLIVDVTWRAASTHWCFDFLPMMDCTWHRVLNKPFLPSVAFIRL